MTISLYARIHALPGHESTVAALLAQLASAVRAEPGNIAFEPWRETESEGSFFVYEVYDDEAAFGAHLVSRHSVEFNAALADHVSGGASELTELRALA
ncbi:putative quinol monooxygenase [Demequina muriae]|uniref:Quinol monooxygenase n=1 Tax=Demequina muriae TaxID=3051664 RepID=A0ABT8GGN2_9MICO|nr:putative quinol monooxygenase [Demequina sp. EGI L300058]MDN4480519.1 putative quinol monooxygenase [Demequina sp. EGI L300058]